MLMDHKSEAEDRFFKLLRTLVSSHYFERRGEKIEPYNSLRSSMNNSQNKLTG